MQQKPTERQDVSKKVGDLLSKNSTMTVQEAEAKALESDPPPRFLFEKTGANKESTMAIDKLEKMY